MPPKLGARIATVVLTLWVSVVARAQPTQTSTTLTTTIDQDTVMRAVIDHFNAGRYEEALRTIDQLGLAATTLAQAQFYAGYSHMRLGRDNEALPRIEATLALTPDDLRAVYLRGVLRDRLDLPGARDDFARVQGGLPDTPIGKASAEYLVANPEPPMTLPAADQAPATSGDPTTSGAGDSVVATPAKAATSPWRLRASLFAAYDTNPSYAANSYLQGGVNNGPNGTSQIATSVPAAPEGTLWVRGEYAPASWGIYGFNGGLTGLARAYLLSTTQAANAVPLQPSGEEESKRIRFDQGGGPSSGGSGSGNTGGTGNPGGTGTVPTTGTIAAAQATSGHQYDYDEVALDLTGTARSSDVDVRAGYRGSVSWLGYDLYAHAHTLWSSFSWPRRAKFRLGLRAQADVFRPVDSAYDFLRGEGGTFKPIFTGYFFHDDLLVELAYALDGYDAANYDGISGQHYSYTFIGHGPDALVSYLLPYDIHLSAWGTLRWKSYFGNDVDPPVSSVSVSRADTLVLAGARLSQTWAKGFSGFGEFTYTSILSNVTFTDHDGNLERMLAALGVSWE